MLAPRRNSQTIKFARPLSIRIFKAEQTLSHSQTHSLGASIGARRKKGEPKLKLIREETAALDEDGVGVFGEEAEQQEENREDGQEEEDDHFDDGASMVSSISMSSARSSRSTQSKMSDLTSLGAQLFHLGTEKLSTELKQLDEADKPMPVFPWCGRCEPIRAIDVLPVMPADLMKKCCPRHQLYQKTSGRTDLHGGKKEEADLEPLERLARLREKLENTSCSFDRMATGASSSSSSSEEWDGESNGDEEDEDIGSSGAETKTTRRESEASRKSSESGRQRRRRRSSRMSGRRSNGDDEEQDAGVQAFQPKLRPSDAVLCPKMRRSRFSERPAVEIHHYNAAMSSRGSVGSDGRTDGRLTLAEELPAEMAELEGASPEAETPPDIPPEALAPPSNDDEVLEELWKAHEEQPTFSSERSDAESDIDAYRVDRTEMYRPPVFRFLTERQLGVLERWSIHHVKSQCVEVCVRAHALAPQKRIKHRLAVAMASACQLLQKLAKRGTLKNDEFNFVKEKLMTLPYICKIPAELIDKVLPQVRVLSYVAGATVLRRGERMKGLYILVQGELELGSGGARALSHNNSLSHNKRLEFPSAVLAEDILMPDSRDFVVRQPKIQGRRDKRAELNWRSEALNQDTDYFDSPDSPLSPRSPTSPMSPSTLPDFSWSRSVKVPMGDESCTMATVLLLPLDLLGLISHHFRHKELEELRYAVLNIFAPTMRVGKDACARNFAYFQLRSLPKNHMLVQATFKPESDRARINVIIEGEVSIVMPPPRKDKKRASKVGRNLPPNPSSRGHVIGEDALYGEPYGYSALVKSETCKVISIAVDHFMERIMNKVGLLDRKHRNFHRNKSGLPRSKAREEHKAHAHWDNGAFNEVDEGAGAEDESEDAVASSATKNRTFNNEAKRLLAQCGRHLRVAEDKQKLDKSDWRTVRSMNAFTPRRAPASSASAALGSNERPGHHDLCYPMEHDISPDAKRKFLAARAAAGVTATPQVASYSAHNTVPSACNNSSITPFSATSHGLSTLHSTLQSISGADSRATTAAPHSVRDLNRLLVKQTMVNRRLEAEHASHAIHRFHVEDMDRPQRPLSDVLSGPPEDSALLFATGAPLPSLAAEASSESKLGPNPARFFVGGSLPKHVSPASRAQTAPMPTGRWAPFTRGGAVAAA